MEPVHELLLERMTMTSAGAGFLWSPNAAGAVTAHSPGARRRLLGISRATGWRSPLAADGIGALEHVNAKL
jgi:hypothetical protein